MNMNWAQIEEDQEGHPECSRKIISDIFKIAEEGILWKRV